ncbi:VOC family protein [Streptomyces microflavus]|uniref:VOC family protein n=1 Tax=Streptomyces microflavus TaxID=1919 RepID=UPI0033F96D2E
MPASSAGGHGRSLAGAVVVPAGQTVRHGRSHVEIVIGADETALPGMCFLPVPERKTVKNRRYIDLTPDDQDAEVERIIALGGWTSGRGRTPLGWCWQIPRATSSACCAPSGR